jgi:repressor LexA
MDMIAFGRRVRAFRESNHIRQEDFADLVGLKKATISRYENGTIKKMDTGLLSKFAHAMRVNEDELLQLPDQTSIRQIPVLHSVTAEPPFYTDQSIESFLGFPGEWRLDFAWRVQGDSMEDAGIPAACIVLCSQTSTAENNEIAVCFVDEGEAMLKRVKYYDGIMVLHAEKGGIEDLIFKGREQNRVKILGVVRHVLCSLSY